MSVKLSFTRGLSRGCYAVARWFPDAWSDSGWPEGPYYFHPCGPFSVGGLSLGQRFDVAFHMLGDWWSQDTWVWDVGFRENLSVHVDVFTVVFLKGWRR
jgi:hypothetical protein